MSISSFENFSEQLQKLPLQNPPKGLLLDVQSTVQRRKAFKQKAMQCSVVLSLFVATLWIVVDQQLKFQPTANVVMNEDEEEREVAATENESISPTVLGLLHRPPSVTQTSIVFRITDIDEKIEKLPLSDTARRQELLQTRAALKENYRSIRLQQQQASSYQKVGYFN